MMRLTIRAGLGLIVALSTSSQAAAQLLPVTVQKSNPRDPFLSRPFQGLTFDGKPAATGPVSRPSNSMDVLLAPHGGRLPEITTAPEPHGTPIPCTIRVVRVTPGFKSNMPVVSVQEPVDSKSVVKVVCLPRE